jgi:hypothetical protein
VRKKAFLPFLLIFILIISLLDSAAISGVIYWCDGGWDEGQVHRANQDGTGKEDLLFSGTYTYLDIAYDYQSQKIYLSGKDKIQRTNLDGTGLEQLVNGSFCSEGIELDLLNDKIYWSTYTGPFNPAATGAIYRSNLDGTGIETIINVDDRINGLALDIPNEKMYWTQIKAINSYQRSSWICRSNLDGGGIEYLAEGIETLGLALNLQAGKMYWTDWQDQKVFWANMDGSNKQELYHSFGNPSGITVDIGNNALYWTEWGTNLIRRSNLDGTAIESMTGTRNGPGGIAIVPEPATVLFLGLGILALARKTSK